MFTLYFEPPLWPHQLVPPARRWESTGGHHVCGDAVAVLFMFGVLLERKLWWRCWLIGSLVKNEKNGVKKKKNHHIPPSHFIPGVGKTAVVTSYLKEIGHKCARWIWGRTVELYSLQEFCNLCAGTFPWIATAWLSFECFDVSFKGDVSGHRKFAQRDVRDLLRQT